MRILLKLFIALPVVISANAASDKCESSCSPEKIYTQCTTKINTLTLEEKALCSKISANCHACNDEKKALINPTKTQCKDYCNTEKLIQCHKKAETLSLQEKAECTKMTTDCQTCTEGKKEETAKTNETSKKCTDICSTEKLIHCNKDVDHLSLEEKAECSKMTSDCQTCNEGNGTVPDKK